MIRPSIDVRVILIRRVVPIAALEILARDRLGEEYSDGTGLFNGSPSDANMMRGKRSADGKTVYWYTNDAGTQFNQGGYTYYYRALG